MSHGGTRSLAILVVLISLVELIREPAGKHPQFMAYVSLLRQKKIDTLSPLVPDESKFKFWRSVAVVCVTAACLLFIYLAPLILLGNLRNDCATNTELTIITS
jgi:hypothetical protein